MTETQSKSDPAPRMATEIPSNLAAHNWGWYLFRGLLALALGILALLYPFSAVTAFALLFAAFAFIDGVGMVISGLVGASDGKERWWGLVIAGLVGIAVGVIYVLWPALSTISYALVFLVMIAAWAFVTGIGQLSAAVRLRRQIEGEWLLGLTGVISILLGFAVLAAVMLVPGASLLSVGWMIGLYALLVAVSLIALAIRLKSAKAKAQGKLGREAVGPEGFEPPT